MHEPLIKGLPDTAFMVARPARRRLDRGHGWRAADIKYLPIEGERLGRPAIQKNRCDTTPNSGTRIASDQSV